MSDAPYLPVQVLRRYITDLEAALVVCQAEPGVKAVHRLRTGTRRVEAMLLLLDRVPGLPEHTKGSAELQKALTHLRRAAGVVRDLDVHREMLEIFAGQEHRLAQAEQPPSTQTASKRTPKIAPTSPEPHAAAALQHSAEELRHHMAHARVAAAEALQSTLQKRQKRTTLAAERLLHALAPAVHGSLSLDGLLGITETVLRRNGRLTAGRIERLDKDQLHDVRKAAKAARYIAETAPHEQSLQEASRRYEGLQEAGGLWHDALELEGAARKAFGRHHALTLLYKTARKQRLADYRAALVRDSERDPERTREAPNAKAPATEQAVAAPPTTSPAARARHRSARQRSRAGAASGA